MTTKRVIALVVGCVLLLPALGVLFGGGAVLLAYTTQRDDDGYFDATIDRLETPTVAVTGEDITFASDPGSPDWVLDVIDVDVRVRVTASGSDDAVFVGIARQDDLAQFLDDVAHDEVVDFDDGEPVYERIEGADGPIGAPSDADIWVARAEGTGTQELEWEPTSGRWAAIVANADGTPGVLVTAEVGAKSGLVLPIAIGLLVAGVLGVAASVVLIVYGASGARQRDAEPPHDLPMPPHDVLVPPGDDVATESGLLPPPTPTVPIGAEPTGR